MAAPGRPGPPRIRVREGVIDRVSERVRRLAAGYEPPSFSHVPDPDAAIFLCAVDHKTGYRAAHVVGGERPMEGSDLMWAVALGAAARRPGLLTAASLDDVDAGGVADLFRIGDDEIADPDRRAALWRDLAAGLLRDQGGSALALLGACGGRLGGEEGLLDRLAAFEAYADPLRKKSFLFAKICARRGWLEVRDPERWEVCVDNVLMRVALRSGLVQPGSLAEVRHGTLKALNEVARRSEIPPPILDDLLWERGRDDPDLLGAAGGDLREPPRDPVSSWY
jgi:hypothetical protein